MYSTVLKSTSLALSHSRKTQAVLKMKLQTKQAVSAAPAVLGTARLTWAQPHCRAASPFPTTSTSLPLPAPDTIISCRCLKKNSLGSTACNRIYRNNLKNIIIKTQKMEFPCTFQDLFLNLTAVSEKVVLSLVCLLHRNLISKHRNI